MADFLTTLARRTLGLEPIVHPLIPPLFAPEPAQPVEFPTDPELDSEPAGNPPSKLQPFTLPVASQKVASAKTLALPVLPVNSPPLSPILAHHPPRPPIQTDPSKLPTELAAPNPSPQTQPITDIAQLPLARPEQATTAADSGAPAAPILTLTPIISLPAAQAAPGQLDPQPTRLNLESEPPPQPPLTEDHFLLVPPARLTATTPAPHPDPNSGLIHPQSRPATVSVEAKRMEQPLDEPGLLPGPPIIRVTIGRIEVRATLPPPATPLPPASLPLPKLSLEDYLRSTNGGRP